ncbi:MAG: VOC family protein [Deltaproteobacteria bacterium]|nr:VOC family protein [Deltaproteobacteria bacterium]MBW2361748.1 VOC family protein [Deltaproteobacteria bacterium]
MQSERTVQDDDATITGCHHLAVCVHDIDEARRFYGEILSLEEVERPPEIAAKFRSAWYRIGTSELHVIENQKFQPLDSPLAPHIAVVTNDFEGLTAQIADRGGQFRFGPGTGPDGILRAIIEDPTGNTLEITTAPLRA